MHRRIRPRDSSPSMPDRPDHTELLGVGAAKHAVLYIQHRLMTGCSVGGWMYSTLP